MAAFSITIPGHSVIYLQPPKRLAKLTKHFIQDILAQVIEKSKTGLNLSLIKEKPIDLCKSQEFNRRKKVSVESFSILILL